jgi:hypothetical protein
MIVVQGARSASYRLIFTVTLSSHAHFINVVCTDPWPSDITGPENIVFFLSRVVMVDMLLRVVSLSKRLPVT